MFTGIIKAKCPIKEIVVSNGNYGALTIEHTDVLLYGLGLGDSVSVDGVCLTVSSIDGCNVVYDVIYSTLKRTIIGDYKVGQLANLERSLTMQTELGGHEVSGHVDSTATIERIESTPGNLCLFFRLEQALGKYIFPRGFIAINGVSLTISDCLEGGSLFSIWLIPETLRITNINELRNGDKVNVEIHRGVQVVVDTIESTITKFLNGLISSRIETNAVGDRTELLTLVEKLIPKLSLGAK